MDIRRDRLLSIVNELELDLSGLTVITECATGHYALTASLAALAGADSVMCFGKDSTHGSFDQARSETQTAADALGVGGLVSFHPRYLTNSILPLSTPTIVTNLRGVRPIDAHILNLAGRPSVVCTMSEAWELREGDVDLTSCANLGIPVASTNEACESLMTIRLVGLLCIQLLAISGLPMANARPLVIGGGKFGQAVVEALRPWNREATSVADAYGLEQLLSSLVEFDYVVNADHEGAVLDLSTWSKLHEALSELAVPLVNMTGLPTDSSYSNIKLFPHRKVLPRTMTATLDVLGPWPVVRLHAGGLRVGQYVLKEMSGRHEAFAPPPVFEGLVG